MASKRRQLKALDYLAIWKELEGKAKPEKKAENIAAIVYSRELEDGCKLFIDTSDGTPFFATADGEVFSLSEKNSDAHARVTAYLYAKYCLSPKFKWADHAVSVLRARALQSHNYKTGHRFVHFDEHKCHLYISRYNGSVRVLDGVPLEGIIPPDQLGPSEIESIPEEEQILFGLDSPPFEVDEPLEEAPFVFSSVPKASTAIGPTNVATQPLDEIANTEEVFFYDDDDGIDVENPIIGPHGQLLDVLTDAAFTANTLGGMTPDQQKKLLIIWSFAVAFPELVRTKPILVFEGGPGSGKSSISVIIQALIHGQETGLMIDKDGAKDFPVQLLKNPIAVFDNVDGYIDWVPDAICAYTTVGVWKRRKLFTDAVEIEIAPKAFPVIASKNPASFRREDVADRLIILRLERRTGAFKPMSNIMNEIRIRRPYLFGEYLYWCNEIVAAYRSGVWGNYENYKLRQADFAQFGLLVAYVFKWPEDEVMAAFDALTREQRAHAVEHDEIVSFLRGWAAWGNASKKFLSANAIFRDVVNYALGNQGVQERDLKFNAASLGSRLRSGSLGDHFQIEEMIDQNSGQHLYLILPKDHGSVGVPRPALDILDGGLANNPEAGSSSGEGVAIAVDFNQRKKP